MTDMHSSDEYIEEDGPDSGAINKKDKKKKRRKSRKRRDDVDGDDGGGFSP